ncbi:MAG TPA: FAD-binding oxidoreductase [Sulfolobales archaeon]|nr:FAD-binding oxidoreductase [Sulfolobales archaeon]
MKHDVVIVGGGLLGQFAALELLSRGYRVAIVEKDILCSGSCSKSTGIMTRQLVLRADIIFAQRSIDIITKMEKEYGELFLRRTGFLTLSPISRVTKRLELVYRSVGIKYKLLEPHEIRELWEAVIVGDNEVGIYTEGDGMLDTGSLSYRIKKEIERNGGSILERCGETSLVVDGKYVARVISESDKCSSQGELFILDVGVNTTSIFTRSFGRTPEPEQFLFKCQSASVDFGGEYEIPIIYDGKNHLYIAPETKRRAIVGDGPCKMARDQNDIAPDREILIETLDKLPERLTGSERSLIIGTTSHVCGTTPDFLPVIGRDSVYENLYLAYGLSSYGTMRSPYLGVEIAKMVNGSKADPLLEVLGPRSSKGLGVCEETHTPIV